MSQTLCGKCGGVECRCGSRSRPWMNGSPTDICAALPVVKCDHFARFLDEPTMNVCCALCGAVLLRPVTPEKLAQLQRRAARRRRTIDAEVAA